MTKIERGSPFRNGRGDEISLPETREKREHEAARYPSKIALYELQHAAIFLLVLDIFYL